MSIGRAYSIQNCLNLHQNEAYLIHFAMEKSTTHYETGIPCESSIFHRQPNAAVSGTKSEINIFKCTENMHSPPLESPLKLPSLCD